MGKCIYSRKEFIPEIEKLLSIDTKKQNQWIVEFFELEGTILYMHLAQFFLFVISYVSLQFLPFYLQGFYLGQGE